jgi:hypothetical protein
MSGMPPYLLLAEELNTDSVESRKSRKTLEERLLKYQERLERAFSNSQKQSHASWLIERGIHPRTAKHEADALSPIHAQILTIRLHDDSNREVWVCELARYEDEALTAMDPDTAKRIREIAHLKYKIRKLPRAQGPRIGVGVANKQSRPGIESEWLTKLGDSLALIAAGIFKLATLDELVTLASTDMLLDAAEILCTLPELKIKSPFAPATGEQGEQYALPFF